MYFKLKDQQCGYGLIVVFGKIIKQNLTAKKYKKQTYAFFNSKRSKVIIKRKVINRFYDWSSYYFTCSFLLKLYVKKLLFQATSFILLLWHTKLLKIQLEECSSYFLCTVCVYAFTKKCHVVEHMFKYMTICVVFHPNRII